MMGPETTLGEAWELIESKCNDGLPCPLCGQRVQVYWRSITTEMALVAIILYRHHTRDPGEYAHVLKLMAAHRMFAGGDYAKLQFWRLAEEEGGVRPDGSSRVGYWRITGEGISWVTGKTRLPRYVRIYNDLALGPPTPYSKSGKNRPLVGIRDALGNKFDYDKLMAGEA